MDEIAVLRAFRSHVPERDREAREAVRRALAARLNEQPTPVWRSRRVWVFVAAALAGIVAASSAFGWTSRVLDLITGEPAPPPVKQVFAVQNEARARQVIPLFRRSPSGDAIVEQTHGVMGINTSVGPVIIWAAPTRGGGICWIVDIEGLHAAGGAPRGALACNPAPLPREIPLHYSVSRTWVGGDRYLELLHGQVSVGVSSLEVRYPDGRAEILPVFERFFLSELRGGVRPNLLIARDAEGAEIERRAIRAPERTLPGIQGPVGPESVPKAVGPERVVIRLETSAGYPLTFSLAPAENGELCQITRYRGTVARGCGPDRRTRVSPEEISVHPGLWNEPPDGKPLVSLDGVVGSAIARLELRYADGTDARIPITEGFVFFEIPPAHHKDERFVLVGRDRDGAEIARRVVK